MRSQGSQGPKLSSCGSENSDQTGLGAVHFVSFVMQRLICIIKCKQPIDMSAARSGFSYRQVFTANLRMSIYYYYYYFFFFFFNIVLDTFVFGSQNRKMFHNISISIVTFKKLTQAFSIIVAVFYYFFKIFAENPKRPKAVNPIRLNQGKPLGIAIDRDLGLTEFSRKKETKER